MNIYQHFRPEEREYIDQVIDWKNYVETHYTPKLTDFLDPREQHILKMLIGENGDVRYSLFGGTEGVERKRAYIFPDYLAASEDDFQISLFGIEYPAKFVTIEHRQVLGTLMSLGLKRGKFGDILMKDGRIQLFAAKGISDFIKSNIESIGRAGVKLVETDITHAIAAKELWNEQDLTVSSLRLDTVISGIYHISRQKSLTYIQHGLVKVNWTVTENPSFACEAGDMISVRGHGRAKIIGIDGKTKREKWRIIAGKQK
ncbi:RNA-binding S4 domain-containing protein [Neobacillus bataviensis LMG 21833]|uniref:RNA-binding S4 domain-containing protein n=1 Tax=Neobacillus bataviensis LMG 21833 TaxID=1117379 RepID=K6D1I9_9BACI|nr:RNA-binding protein [Neobacillus bataviensis]EKN66357.1 RNA-binding S4 domain-containing protein [Neobacillus bataviensis LMG 21833]